MDQLLLAGKHAGTTANYNNPLGGLVAYLNRLTPDERMAQARIIVHRPIITVFQNSYLNGLPSRADIMRAAGKKYLLEPALIAAFVLAEQRDQSANEDAVDYSGATSLFQANTSIGLGQIVVSTAKRFNIFDDLLGAGISATLDHNKIAEYLTSDELNIFGVAKYIRDVADAAAGLNINRLPNTLGSYPNIDLKAYGKDSKTWPDDNIRALGSEYTSRAWDDRIFPHWANFVFEAYKDMKASKAI